LAAAATTPEIYELPPDHGWTARPGYKILVLDRGAVILEFPSAWSVQPGPHYTSIRDQPSPETSTCVLAVSYLRLPPVDWTGLPLRRLLLDAVLGDDREHIAVAPVVQANRAGVELAWADLRVVDPGEGREAHSRMCLARGNGIQCLITFDSWPEDEARLRPVWSDVLDSLRLGAVVDDPSRGRRIG
jgi:hypothetical protein